MVGGSKDKFLLTMLSMLGMRVIVVLVGAAAGEDAVPALLQLLTTLTRPDTHDGNFVLGGRPTPALADRVQVAAVVVGTKKAGGGGRTIGIAVNGLIAASRRWRTGRP